MRIIRACRELGVPTVAIYSEADPTGIYVKKADEAYLVGSDPIRSFLNMERIVQLANETGCDAIHPGYGFLAENADFARYCARYGVTFIGPSPLAIHLMGNKVRARQVMMKAGVPVIPGTQGAVRTSSEATLFAERAGYPIMVKASAGGGGRGLRIARNETELLDGLEAASREANAAFGESEVFLEKYLERPHHIEFQIVADKHGNTIHLGERDCSIQRRHQKLIEIAPSLVLDAPLRARMGEMAVIAAQAVHYNSVGTVEFLLDKDYRFYFMEMNTRIQVEHTVTEQITSIDLVRTQIEIAAGIPLDIRQQDVSFQGHSIQCRINAEDPKKDFLPSTGEITAYYSPGGVGVRIDGAVYKGYVISPYYDTMLVKLVVQGRTWNETVRRMRRSLEEFVLRGVKTTIPFMEQVMDDPDFLAGNFDTGYLEHHPHVLEYEEETDPEDLVAAISAAIASYEGL